MSYYTNSNIDFNPERVYLITLENYYKLKGEPGRGRGDYITEHYLDVLSMCERNKIDIKKAVDREILERMRVGGR